MRNILQTKIKLPIIFTFNIRRSLYQSFGLTHFAHIQQYFKYHLLPVITDIDGAIQSRAYQISQALPLLLKQIKADKVHVVSYSASGLDMRFALNRYNIHENVETLHTISTPHKGSYLADISENKGLQKKVIEPIAKAMGIGYNAFHELIPDNIAHFNQTTVNNPKIKYFSIGGEKNPQSCSQVYQKSCHYMRTKKEVNFVYENDGVFCHDEVQWGKHLVNLQYDHSQIIGIGFFKGQTFKLIQQNIRYYQATSIQKDSVLADIKKRLNAEL